MEYKINDNKVFFRIDKGEELIESITKLCKDEGIGLGAVSGIGAAQKIEVGYLDTKTNQYVSKTYSGIFEITSLNGNVTTMYGETYIHLHVNFSDIKNKTFGGHLNLAKISVTFEGFIDIMKGEVDREFSDKVGVNLVKF